MKLFIFGTKGRMSLAISELAETHADIEVSKQPTQGCAIIDFTSSDAFETHIKTALELSCPYMVGTTGLSPDHFQMMEEVAQKIPVLWASNTSLGANLLFELMKIASTTLAHFPIAINDVHHKHKKDAPSGTALTLQQAAGRPCDISSYRVEDAVGIHEIVFTGAHESIALRHEVTDRKVFAEGAILASRFLSEQKPGLYTMQDVLGLKQ
ncbi:MAG: dihydrodipicolinate reductase C-terminal domain-containing protein [Myxococcota bacterium]